jgi:hypothetical protein
MKTVVKKWRIDRSCAGSVHRGFDAVKPPACRITNNRGPREIGAVYPEGKPYALVTDIVARQTFDVLLFVDTTTAARKNRGR